MAIGQTPSVSDSESEPADRESVISPLAVRKTAVSLNEGMSPSQRQMSFRKMPKIKTVPDLKKEVKAVHSELIPRRGPGNKIKNELKKLKKIVPQTDILRHDKGSPEVQRTFDAILRVHVVAAANLKGANRDRTSDPFVWIKLGDRKLKTTTKKKTCEPVWNEEFQIKVKANEIQRGVLEFTVKDYDKWSKNTILGNLIIPIREIMTAEEVIRKEYPLSTTKQGTLTLELEMLSVYSVSEIEVKSTGKDIQNTASISSGSDSKRPSDSTMSSLL